MQATIPTATALGEVPGVVFHTSGYPQTQLFNLPPMPGALVSEKVVDKRFRVSGFSLYTLASGESDAELVSTHARGACGLRWSFRLHRRRL